MWMIRIAIIFGVILLIFYIYKKWWATSNYVAVMGDEMYDTSSSEYSVSSSEEYSSDYESNEYSSDESSSEYSSDIPQEESEDD